MDILAGAVSKATGWAPSRLAAEYYETEDAGIARLKSKAPSFAMVPLPFYLAHANDLKLTPRAQAGQGEMGILPAGDDQVHLWRQVLEQKGEGFVNRFGINHMIVVQDKDEIVRGGGDFIEQGCQNRLG